MDSQVQLFMGTMLYLILQWISVVSSEGTLQSFHLCFFDLDLGSPSHRSSQLQHLPNPTLHNSVTSSLTVKVWK